MAAADLDLTIEQGTTYTNLLTIKNDAGTAINLTGGSFKSQVRSGPTSPTVIAEFTMTLLDQNTLPGQVSMQMTASQTGALVVPDQVTPSRKTSKFVYDVDWTKADGSIVRILQGNVIVTPSVTRV